MKNLIFFFALLIPFFSMAQTTCESCPDLIDKQLIVNGSIPPAGWSVTYGWDNGITSTTNTADVTIAGTYTATVTWTDDSGSCTDVLGTHTFEVTEFPVIELTCRYKLLSIDPWIEDCDIVICENDGLPVIMDVSPFGDDNNCTLSSPSGIVYGTNTGLVTILEGDEENGVWLYECEDRNGCPVTKEFTMTIIEKPIITLTGECIDN